jgi:hypothetical protein
VVTSTYDVARGQFSGGLISTTSRGGTNVVQGGTRYTLRDDDLALASDATSPTATAFTQHQVSLGLGGPLVRNRLFVFVSGQTQIRSDAQLTLLSATPQDLTRLGVHPDSVVRFREAVTALGVQPDLFPPDDRGTTGGSALLRLDWVATGSHTVTVRGDWQGSGQEPTRIAALGLPQTGGTTGNWGAGLMFAVTSRVTLAVINEIRAYGSRGGRESDPLLTLPSGRVLVVSDLGDATGTSTLQFGGNAGMPTANRTSTFELTDELSWLPGRAAHRFRLGALVRRETASGLDGPDGLGTYTYTSLAALQANQAVQYRRTLPGADLHSATTAWAAWAGDIWRAARGLQVTYGLRLEGGAAGPAPEYNPLVDSTFGRRTDRLPSERHLSPRAGFTWTLGSAPGGLAGFAPPRWTLRGGLGEYRSPLPSGLMRSAQTGTGLGGSDGQLICVGAGVPQANWSTWLSDPSAVPTSCAAALPSLGGAAPGVILLADDFAAPRSWRGSLGVQRALSTLLRLHVDVSWARGVSQYGFIDLNLPATPAFTLSNEADRPMYAPPAAITPSGAVSNTAARVVPSLGQVIEARSDLASESRQVTMGVQGVLRRGALVNVSWTHASARDQESGGRFGARSGLAGTTTAGDPTVRAWGPSDFERRNSFLATLTWPFGPTLELTGIGRLTSGTAFTPLVDGDINGDGARNDRAFVFPDAATLGIACLTRQVGTIAGRNSCRGPWTGTFDLQANWRPNLFGLNRRLAVSIVTVNLLRGVDELVHGSDDARGWGMTLRPNPILQAVTGFDHGTQTFRYTMNERFGSTRGAAGFRAPFQIGIQARLTIGPDRQRQALDQVRQAAQARPNARPGAGGGRGAGANAGEFFNRFTTLVVNPAERVLALNDSLGLVLDAAQISQLEGARDSLQAKFDLAADSAQADIARIGLEAGPQPLLQALRPRIEDAWRHVLATARAVRTILTEEQWNVLPEDLRTPRRPGMTAPARRP